MLKIIGIILLLSSILFFVMYFKLMNEVIGGKTRWQLLHAPYNYSEYDIQAFKRMGVVFEEYDAKKLNQLAEKFSKNINGQITRSNLTDLRFIERHGRKILQFLDVDGMWYDVPFVDGKDA